MVRAQAESSRVRRKESLTRRHRRRRLHNSEDPDVDGKSCNVGDTNDKLQLEQIKTLTSLHSIVMALTSKYKDKAFVSNLTNAPAHPGLWINNLQRRNSQVHGFKNFTYCDIQPG